MGILAVAVVFVYEKYSRLLGWKVHENLLIGLRNNLLRRVDAAFYYHTNFWKENR